MCTCRSPDYVESYIDKRTLKDRALYQIWAAPPDGKTFYHLLHLGITPLVSRDEYSLTWWHRRYPTLSVSTFDIEATNKQALQYNERVTHSGCWLKHIPTVDNGISLWYTRGGYANRLVAIEVGFTFQIAGCQNKPSYYNIIEHNNCQYNILEHPIPLGAILYNLGACMIVQNPPQQPPAKSLSIILTDLNPRHWPKYLQVPPFIINHGIITDESAS